MTYIQERNQLAWGIDLYLKFLLFASQRGTLDPTEVEELEKKLKKLTIEIQKTNTKTSYETLNQCIQTGNTQMKQRGNPTLYAPFPLFSYIKEGEEKSGILDQLDMVERTLTEAAHAQILDMDQEGRYFSEILALFSQAEVGKIQEREAMARLAAEIEKINQSLAPEYHFPPLIFEG